MEGGVELIPIIQNIYILNVVITININYNQQISQQELSATVYIQI